MTKRHTKDWAAIESTDLTGANRRLTVTGEVETFVSNEKATLREAVPQGTNPKILILDLSVAADGIGAEVLGWTTATFTRAISLHQYDQVTIRTDDADVTIDVEEIHSLTA